MTSPWAFYEKGLVTQSTQNCIITQLLARVVTGILLWASFPGEENRLFVRLRVELLPTARSVCPYM
jgi:hypothetical protein